MVSEPRVLSASDACKGYAECTNLVASEAGLFWLQNDPPTGVKRLWHLGHHHNELVHLYNANLGVRSKVNSYGGGAISASSSGVFVVSECQNIHFIHQKDKRCQVLTNDAAAYGGLTVDPLRHRVLAIRETDGPGTESVPGKQELVAVSLEGKLEVLHSGQDFYGAPALSSDGRHLAWVSWQWPDMPWLRTRLWIASVGADGKLTDCQCHDAPNDASIQQPVFAGQALWVISDHKGWWQPWRFDQQAMSNRWLPGDDVPLLDHANAPWQLSESHHCPLPGDRWARVCYRNGTGELWLSGEGASVRVADAYSDFRCLCTAGGYLYAIAKSATQLDAVLKIDSETCRVCCVAGGEDALTGHHVSLPQTFQVTGFASKAQTLCGFYYPPVGHSNKAPPLILIVHGGPTSAVYPVFNPQVQFWCHRGFAVAEVNYRGSSGFGRNFRLSLAGQWGEFDVEDIGRTADYLVAVGLADGQQVFVQGRSSGGYTALMALVNTARYTAGASVFGVTDPLQLRRMTHRFESGYLDWLLGKPEHHAQRWRARTPKLQATAIRTPVIFFQGGQDKVVVPEQTRAMIAAMEKVGQTPELHWFDSEGHGFLQKENQVMMFEKLHDFYQRYRLMTF